MKMRLRKGMTLWWLHRGGAAYSFKSFDDARQWLCSGWKNTIGGCA